MFRRQWPVALLLAVLIALASTLSTAAGEQDDGWIKLFNGKDFTGWKRFLSPKSKADPDKVFTVQDGVIVVDGGGPGYLITEKEYDNYVLRLQWRWGEKAPRGGNSGVCVHVIGPDMVWPRCLEVQLQAGRAGDFWLLPEKDHFKVTADPKRQNPKSPRHYRHMKDGVEKPVGEWNQCEITCKGDTIQVIINGEPANEGTNAESSKGKILLQSEGAEIHFRNVELKPIK
jgi:hypothetical protein